MLTIPSSQNILTFALWVCQSSVGKNFFYLGKLRKNPATENIPIVACTVKNSDVDRMWAKKQGVKAYVTKPCTKDQLATAVKEAIGL